MTPLRSALILAVACAPPIAFGCQGSNAGAATASSAPSTSSSAFTVEKATVMEKTLEQKTDLPAEIFPYEQVDVFPRVSAFVSTVKVDRGSTVKKGDLLARLEAPELTSQRLEAEAKWVLDKSTLERLQAAAKATPGSVSEQDVDAAGSAVRSSSAKVQSLRTLESYLVVTAPFDGIVTERNVHPGALVSPPSGAKPTPMFHVEAVKTLRLTVAVPEAYVGALAVGASLDFLVSAWPKRNFQGVVKRVAESVDTKTRTMPVECDVDNADGALSPGMYATVHWLVRRSAPTLFVPETAIVQSTERTFVVRITDGKAQQVTVQRGGSMPGLVEVFGDLHVDDVIAKRGSEELREGTPVLFRDAAPPKGSGS